MSVCSRRRFTLAALAAAGLAAGCANGIGSDGAQIIDARVQSTLNFMFSNYPGTQELADASAGMLVMPLVTEAGLIGFGGAYGRGALLIDGVPVDYYSATQASVGFQIGAQQYAHVLFFMTEEALAEFRASPGWAAGADITYAINDEGQTLAAATTTVLTPTIAVVFGQAGLIAGATLEGTKYTRIIP